MTREEQAHIDRAYANIRTAMDELVQVRDKDRYLIKIQGALYKMEDMLYQYASDPKRRNNSESH